MTAGSVFVLYCHGTFTYLFTTRLSLTLPSSGTLITWCCFTVFCSCSDILLLMLELIKRLVFIVNEGWRLSASIHQRRKKSLLLLETEPLFDGHSAWCKLLLWSRSQTLDSLVRLYGSPNILNNWWVIILILCCHCPMPEKYFIFTMFWELSPL
jgi:hypothetical protein